VPTDLNCDINQSINERTSHDCVSQHGPLPHLASPFSRQVVGTQQRIASHASGTPQSHSSPSSRMPLPHTGPAAIARGYRTPRVGLR